MWRSPIAFLYAMLVAFACAGEGNDDRGGQQAPFVSPPALPDTPKPDDVLAYVGQEPITVREVDASIRESLDQLYADFYAAQARGRYVGLEAMIFTRLVEAEAKENGLAVEELLRQEIEGKVPQVTAEEARQWFRDNPDKMGNAPYGKVQGQIIETLTFNRRKKAADAYRARLHTEAGVRILVKEPPPAPKPEADSGFGDAKH